MSENNHTDNKALKNHEDHYKTVDQFISDVIARAESKEHQGAKQRLYNPVDEGLLNKHGQRNKLILK